MISINHFIASFSPVFAKWGNLPPWEITNKMNEILLEQIARADNHFHIENGIAIHKTAMVEKGAIIKSPVIIGEGCFIGSNACLRGGVYLDGQVKIGMGCEIKTTMIFRNSSIAHFNFVGDSIIGSQVNFEAGAIAANHYNERDDKNISAFFNAQLIQTGSTKFGALVGDNSKIGANAVLSPGTILMPGSIVKRLELVEQGKQA